MRREYSGEIEDRWPEPFALIDDILAYVIARQEALTDPYLKGVLMEDIIDAVVDYRIDLISRLSLGAHLTAGRHRGEGSPNADEVRSSAAR